MWQKSSGQGLAGWVVRHKQPVIMDDAQHDTWFFRQITDGTGVEVDSLLCAPPEPPRGEESS